MSKIKVILGLIVMVGAAYLCLMLIPPFFANYQFEDAIKTEGELSTYSTKSEEAIGDSVYKKAQELEIPLSREQIRVRRTGFQGSGSVIIEASYTVHVDLPVYPLDLEFNPGVKNKGVF